MTYIRQKHVNEEDLRKMSIERRVDEADKGLGSFGNVGEHRSVGDKITAGNNAKHDSDPNDKSTSEDRYNGNR